MPNTYKYTVGDKVYDIPTEKRDKFEKKYPDAKIGMYGGGEYYDIPLSMVDKFLNKYADAQFDVTEDGMEEEKGNAAGAVNGVNVPTETKSAVSDERLAVSGDKVATESQQAEPDDEGRTYGNVLTRPVVVSAPYSGAPYSTEENERRAIDKEQQELLRNTMKGEGSEAEPRSTLDKGYEWNREQYPTYEEYLESPEYRQYALGKEETKRLRPYLQDVFANDVIPVLDAADTAAKEQSLEAVDKAWNEGNVIGQLGRNADATAFSQATKARIAREKALDPQKIIDNVMQAVDENPVLRQNIVNSITKYLGYDKETTNAEEQDLYEKLFDSFRKSGVDTSEFRDVADFKSRMQDPEQRAAFFENHVDGKLTTQDGRPLTEEMFSELVAPRDLDVDELMAINARYEQLQGYARDVIYDMIYQELVSRSYPSGVVEEIARGVGDSLVGSLVSTMIESGAGTNGLRRKIRQEASNRYQEGLPYWERNVVGGVKGGVGLAADAAAFALFGGASSAVANGLFKLGTRAAMGNAVGSTIANRVIGSGYNKALQWFVNAGKGTLTQMGTFGMYGGANELARQLSEQEKLNLLSIVEAAGDESKMGAVLGGLGAAGELVKPISVAGKLTKAGVQGAAELGTFTVMQAIDEAKALGKDLSDLDWSDWGRLGIQNAALLGTLKLNPMHAGEGIAKIQNLFTKASREGMGLTKYHDQLMQQEGLGFSDLLRSLRRMSNEDAAAAVSDYYKKVTENERIPQEAKKWVRYYLDGTYVKTAPIMGATVEDVGRGKKRLVYKDIDGNIVDEKVLDAGDVQKELPEVQKEILLNTTSVLTQENFSPTYHLSETAAEVAARNHMSYKAVVDAVMHPDGANESVVSEFWRLANRKAKVYSAEVLTSAADTVKRETGVDVERALRSKNKTAEQLRAIGRFNQILQQEQQRRSEIDVLAGEIRKAHDAGFNASAEQMKPITDAYERAYRALQEEGGYEAIRALMALKGKTPEEVAKFLEDYQSDQSDQSNRNNQNGQDVKELLKDAYMKSVQAQGIENKRQAIIDDDMRKKESSLLPYRYIGQEGVYELRRAKYQGKDVYVQLPDMDEYGNDDAELAVILNADGTKTQVIRSQLTDVTLPERWDAVMRAEREALERKWNDTFDYAKRNDMRPKVAQEGQGEASSEEVKALLSTDGGEDAKQSIDEMMAYGAPTDEVSDYIDAMDEALQEPMRAYYNSVTRGEKIAVSDERLAVSGDGQNEKPTVSDERLAMSGDKVATESQQTEQAEEQVEEEGEPDYKAIGKEKTYEYIYEQNELTKEEADMIVDNHLKKAQWVLDDLQKSKPVPGTNIAKYKKELSAWAKAEKAANEDVQYWQEVKKYADWQAELDKPEEADTRNPEVVRAVDKMFRDGIAFGDIKAAIAKMDPQLQDEAMQYFEENKGRWKSQRSKGGWDRATSALSGKLYDVADEIASLEARVAAELYGKRFLWKTIEEGGSKLKGLEGELFGSRQDEERRKRIGWLASRENGGQSVDEVVHDIYEALNSVYYNGELDSSEVKDIVIDYLMRYNSPQGLGKGLLDEAARLKEKDDAEYEEWAKAHEEFEQMKRRAEAEAEAERKKREAVSDKRLAVSGDKTNGTNGTNGSNGLDIVNSIKQNGAEKRRELEEQVSKEKAAGVKFLKTVHPKSGAKVYTKIVGGKELPSSYNEYKEAEKQGAAVSGEAYYKAKQSLWRLDKLKAQYPELKTVEDIESAITGLNDYLDAYNPSKEEEQQTKSQLDALKMYRDLLGKERDLREKVENLDGETAERREGTEARLSLPADVGTTSTQEEITSEEGKVNTEPTEGQKKAGNYKMGHIKVDGFDVTIENPKGSVRRGKDADGKEWESTMNNSYGYIRGTEGVDGDHIDVFLSDHPDDGYVFVIDQVNPKTGEFDEHKVMYGFDSAVEAADNYLANYEEGWQGLGAIYRVDHDEFKKWIKSSHRKTKPFGDYAGTEALGYSGIGRGVKKAGGETSERLDVDAIRRRAEQFKYDTPEESAAFERSVPDMSDEELLSYMQADGGGNVNEAYHKSLYDEYDTRHSDEYADMYKMYDDALGEDPTEEQLEYMLSEVQRQGADGGFANEDRTRLLAQSDLLMDRLQVIEAYRERMEASKDSPSIIENRDVDNDESFEMMHSDAEKDGLRLKTVETFEDYCKRNNIDEDSYDALWYFHQKYGGNWEKLDNLLKDVEEDAEATGYVVGKMVDSVHEGYAMLRLLNNIRPEDVLKFYDGVAEGFMEAENERRRRGEVTDQKVRIEQREIGRAMVDRLEQMGFDVEMDPTEMRKMRKQAERDQSEEGKMRHFRTLDGKVYGFTYRGKMYLDPTKIDAELPIHEYAHPWCEAIRRLNADGWKSVVGLMKSDADTWNFVRRLNPDLKSDDDIAEEMIAKYSGERGAELARAEYERMNGKDPEYSSKWGNIWKNISKAIQDFWNQVGDFLHIKYDSTNQVYDQVVRDFANKVNPRSRVEAYLRERDADYMQAVEGGDEVRAAAIFEEALKENIGNGMTPYVAAGNYRDQRRLARGVKSRDAKVVAEVADRMAPLIPKDAVLVPAPSRTGEATDMLDVAKALSERTGAPVADVLRGSERRSQFEAKKAGEPLRAGDMRVILQGELPEGKIPVVIDNVVDTGNTAEACVKALGKGVVVSLADSADKYRHVASLKSAAPVVRDKDGNVVPLSKRFEMGSKRLDKPTRYAESDDLSPKALAAEFLDKARRHTESIGKKLGVKINVVENVAEIPKAETRQAIRDGKKILGWYDTSSGEVYVYMPHISDFGQIDRTCVHEIVAHKGLRQLLGQAKFDQLCDAVYASMDEASRERFGRYAGIDRFEGKDRERAMADEYIAKLAERADLNNSTWRRIVAWVREQLRNIGINVKMSDEDISDLLRRSYERLERNAQSMKSEEGLGGSKDDGMRANELIERVPGALMQNFGSAGTSLNQIPSGMKKIDWKSGTVNVDIGGGRFDTATEYMKSKGVENLVFDPFNRGAAHNKEVAERVRDNKVDTATSHNVLNVIDSKDARENVILQAAKAIKPEGTAYFTVYEGDKSDKGRQTMKDSWQNNRPTRDYVDEISQYFDDVKVKNNVIIAKNPKETTKQSIWDFDGEYKGNDVRFGEGNVSQNGLLIGIDDRLSQKKYLSSNNYVSSLSGSEFEKSKEPLVDRVVKYYTDNYGGEVKRDGFGVVFLDKRGVKDSISHGFGRNKAAAFAAVPEIIKNGALIDYKENWKGRGLDGYTIVAPVKIGNDGFVGVVVITRGKGTNKNKFYLHEVVLQKNLQEESFKTDTKADSHQGDIAKLMQKIFSTKEKTEKIAENSGNLYNEGENEESKRIFEQAKKLFGTTRDVREAGYVLPDGSMLDFSGRHLMNPGSDTSFLRGRRTTDHRDISSIAYEKDGNTKTGVDTDMPDFIRRGAIRIDDNAGNINLSGKPTASQKEALRQLIARNDGYVQVDFGDGWDSEHYVEYDGAKPSKVLADIDRYYNEGIKPQSSVRFRDGDIFLSNAAKAVEGIAQEKATPEQWLKMIEKAGGLKAGEDKWMGLSDWLREQAEVKMENGKVKNLTKQEVLDYIRENQVRVEEVKYADQTLGRYDEHWNYLRTWLEENTDNPDAWYNTITENYGYRDGEGFTLNQGTRMPKQVTDMVDRINNSIDKPNPINTTRLSYTTKGLKNKKEIALVVPTIEPWNEGDKVHFGDAGEGRAVAWIRFGDTEIHHENKEHELAAAALYDWERHIEGKYGFDNPLAWDMNKLTPEEVREMGRLEQEYKETLSKTKTEKVLVIDEIQSKRHQKGRENGYEGELATSPKGEYLAAEKAMSDYRKSLQEKYGEFFVDDDLTEEEQKEYKRLYRDMFFKSGYNKDKLYNVPDAPFEKNWHELAMKRMLRYAAEHGYDKVAWTKGEQQADRYDIRNVVEDLYYKKNEDGTFNISVQTKDSRGHGDGRYDDYGVQTFPNQSEADLANLLGKETAQKIIEGKGRKGYTFNGETGWTTFKGNDLKIGGEGMKGFYDQMLPRFMDKYGKKWGVKTGEVELPNVEKAGRKMWAVDITPEMKESVMQGQVMFREDELGGVSPKDIDTLRIQPDADGVRIRMKMKDGRRFDAYVWKNGERKGVVDVMYGDRKNVDEWVGKNISDIFGSEVARAILDSEAGTRTLTDEEMARISQRYDYDILRHIKQHQDLFEEEAYSIGDKLGLDLDIIKDPSERNLTGRYAKAKGWYDEDTGKITIVLSNNRDGRDVVRTVLHEGVAHHGLRQLFGDNFNTFLDNVYSMADKSIRSDIDTFVKANGGDVRVGVEEYLAHLAETLDYSDSATKTWWNKIKQAFFDWMHTLGLTSYSGPALNDSELRYILWGSYKNLEQPGRWDNLFSLAEGKAMERKFRRQQAGTLIDTAITIDKRLGDVSEADRIKVRNAIERRMEEGGIVFTDDVVDMMQKAKDGKVRFSDRDVDDEVRRISEAMEAMGDMGMDIPEKRRGESDRAFEMRLRRWQRRVENSVGHQQETVDRLGDDINDAISSATAAISNASPSQPLDGYEQPLIDLIAREQEQKRRIEEARHLQAQRQARNEERMSRGMIIRNDLEEGFGVDLSKEGWKRTIKDEIRERRRAIETGNLEDAIFVHELKRMTTPEERRLIPYMLEGSQPVPPHLNGVIERIRGWYDDIYNVMMEEGLFTGKQYKSYIDNYVTHIWDFDKSDPDAVASMRSYIRMSDPYTRTRVVKTLKDGLEMGLKPKYDDIADILLDYGHYATETIANRRLVKFIKGLNIEEKGKNGEPYYMPVLIDDDVKDADYQRIDNNALDGYKVYKRAVNDLNVIFGKQHWSDNKLLQKLGRMYDTAGSVMKKVNLSLSFFHHGALTETALPMMGVPAFGKAVFKNMIWDAAAGKKGIDAAYYDEAATRDAVKHLVVLGATQDYQTKDVQRITGKIRELMTDKNIWGAKQAAIAADWINKGMDKFLWDYLHDGYKIYAFKKIAKEIREKAEQQGWTETQAERALDEAGQLVNDTFGGQHWDLLGQSPSSVKWLRRLLLSPDWTVSTIRQALAPFGVGRLYDDKRFAEQFKQLKSGGPESVRAKYAITFWTNAALVWGTIANALNAYMRRKDEEEETAKAEERRMVDPSYKSPYELAYPDGMKWYDYMLPGNTLGHQTHLFAGRYDDGTETYLRWGKQFREMPELFFGREGFSFPGAALEKIAGKLNPMINLAVNLVGGVGVSGFKNPFMQNKTGLERDLGRLYTLLSAFTPYSIPTDREKEFVLASLVMPDSKGYTAYKARRDYETAIKSGDMSLVEKVYDACVMNGLDAEDLYKTTYKSILSETRKEMLESFDNVNDAVKYYDNTDDVRKRMQIKKYIAEQMGAQDWSQIEKGSLLRNIEEGVYDSDESNSEYMKVNNAQDVIDDWRLSKDLTGLKSWHQEYLDNGGKPNSKNDPGKEYREAHPEVDEWYILNRASQEINKLKKELGKGNDDEVMAQIRKVRSDAFAFEGTYDEYKQKYWPK